MTQLQQLRTEIKRRRLNVSAHQRAAASGIIAAKLLAMPQVQRARNIAVYMATQGEIDCDFFLSSANLRKKRIFLPVLRNSGLAFAPLKKPADMRPNGYGILEPVYGLREIVRPTFLDLVIAPLVIFDSSCNRVGMGGGFYDRCFAFRKRRQKWRKPFLIGVAYEFQRFDGLQPEPWDVAMDSVVTEQKTYLRNSS